MTIKTNKNMFDLLKFDFYGEECEGQILGIEVSLTQKEETITYLVANVYSVARGSRIAIQGMVPVRDHAIFLAG